MRICPHSAVALAAATLLFAACSSPEPAQAPGTGGEPVAEQPAATATPASTPAEGADAPAGDRPGGSDVAPAEAAPGPAGADASATPAGETPTKASPAEPAPSVSPPPAASPPPPSPPPPAVEPETGPTGTAAAAPAAEPPAPPPAAPSPPPAPAAAPPDVVVPDGPVRVAATKAGLANTGADKCGKCHKVQLTSWRESEHAKLATPLDCEGCHGPGSEYQSLKVMKDPEAAKAAGLVKPDAAFCARCHVRGWSDDMLAEAHAHKTP